MTAGRSNSMTTALRNISCRTLLTKHKPRWEEGKVTTTQTLRCTTEIYLMSISSTVIPGMKATFTLGRTPQTLKGVQGRG